MARLTMLVLHDDAQREHAGPVNGLPDTGTRRLTPVEAASGNEDFLRYCNTNPPETFSYCK
jgi:hypothetical protein